VIDKLLTLRIWAMTLKNKNSGKTNLSYIFGGFIVILVDLVLFPTVQTTVDDQLVNASAATQALGDLIPLFWILIGLGIAAAMVYSAFKD